ncbi:hypothetical protein FRB96_002759 [Tulasnella sp. 330]|nr:hypothetical protein FRB96_002759 [Tulasnella sp. 330]
MAPRASALCGMSGTKIVTHDPAEEASVYTRQHSTGAEFERGYGNEAGRVSRVVVCLDPEYNGRGGIDERSSALSRASTPDAPGPIGADDLSNCSMRSLSGVQYREWLVGFRESDTASIQYAVLPHHPRQLTAPESTKETAYTLLAASNRNW